jgi:hypothetical protein
MSPKLVTIEGAARLCRAGMFADQELIGVTEFGHAVYNSHKTIVVRVQGPRPAGTEVAPIALGCYSDFSEEASAMRRHAGRQRGRKS